MYETPKGKRTLKGAERRLFETSLGMIADYLSDDDYASGVERFDELQRTQKIAVLLGVSKALLREDVPPPVLTAVAEAAVASVFQHLQDRLGEEIEGQGGQESWVDPEWLDDDTYAEPASWRSLILAACREAKMTNKLPDVESCEPGEWELLIVCLQDRILWDTDWEMPQLLDADPQQGRPLKEGLGIDDGYYVAVPPDPTDEEAARMIAELYHLTPEGRPH